MILELKDVSKNFGKKCAVNNLSFKVDKPSVYGLLGTNGAGKTTTIRMILGIIKKDKGTVLWNNEEVTREKVNFGYLPEERGLYPKTTVLSQLLYFAELKNIKKKDALKRINYLAKKLKVSEYLNSPAEKLSKGNQQKVQFLASIIHDPELLVLDEPFSGLDPVNTKIIKDFIIEMVNNGKYIILSAHQMSVIEEFCSDILILDRGKTVLKGNLKEIKAQYPANRLQLNVNEDIKDILKKFNLEVELEKNLEYTIKIDNEEVAHKLLKELIKNNINILKFEIMKPALNDIFIECVEG